MLRAALAAALGVSLLLPLSACAGSYAGIPLAAGAADPELQALARKAQSGDKQAQLELGIRYEEGRGVAVDLERAKRLYFGAATKPSRYTTAIYHPSRRAGMAGSVQLLRGPAEFSGIPEALLRWQRLLKASEDDGHREAPRTTSAAPFREPLEEEWQARRELIEHHGYQPIFNGLKHRESPWEEGIVAEDGARFLTPASVRDTFLFILDPPPRGEAGKSPSRERMLQLCQSASVSMDPRRSSERRLAGLCAVLRCDFISRADWRSLADAVRFNEGSGATGLHSAAHDAAFLLRVATRCGEASAAEGLVGAVDANIEALAQLRSRCSRGACRREESALARRALSSDVHLLLGAAEGAAIPPPLLKSAAERLVANRIVGAPDTDPSDPEVAALCNEAAVAASRCRAEFPHSHYLERQYLAVAAPVLSEDGQISRLCELLREFRQTFAKEISIRFERLESSVGQIPFAAGCPPTKDKQV